MPKKTLNLGPEWDDATRAALKRALESLDATTSGTSWGVGGSQELETSEVFVGGSVVVVESETYIGLTITGENELVETIARLVREQLPGKRPG